MKVFSCTCGNRVHFENTRCVACASELGWCPACQRISTLVPIDHQSYRCGQSSCGVRLQKCDNYAVENVCNRCYVVRGVSSSVLQLCDCCQFNDTIPDLAVAGNREKWRALETAKRRLFYSLNLLDLPYGREEDGFWPSLSFDFKADGTIDTDLWWRTGETERVWTGYCDGKITINTREADPVEREKSRVHFNETRRTIIGHFCHEIAHYYWQMLVQGQLETKFVSVFGNHQSKDYTLAQQNHYRFGPQRDWQNDFVSGYATMHPLEDFAETFAAYLNITSILDTASNMEVTRSYNPTASEIPEMLEEFTRLGIILNEMNRAMGMPDLVSEVVSGTVKEKLGFVHELVRGARCATNPPRV